jgi:hypothetical protein
MINFVTNVVRIISRDRCVVQIITIDPAFMEAYNRRATALYGLQRVQECFSDLEMVLKQNPLHYGALCGKVPVFPLSTISLSSDLIHRVSF